MAPLGRRLSTRRRFLFAAVGLLALAPFAAGITLAAEAWAGSATLPPWLPAAPAWVGRLLHALPLTHSGAWKQLRVRTSNLLPQPSSLPDPRLGYHPSQSTLSPGSYHGWSDGTTAQLVLYGHACSADDPLTSLSLEGKQGWTEVERASLDPLLLDVGSSYPMAVTRVTKPLMEGSYGPRALARCRSGAEWLHQIGAVEVSTLPPNPAGLLIESVTAPLVGLYSELFLLNPGPHAATVRGVSYGPTSRITGDVLALAPPVGEVARIEQLVGDRRLLDPEEGRVVTGDDPGLPPNGTGRIGATSGWPVRAADDLFEVLEPGGTMLLVIYSDSFYAAHPRLPALFHPVVRYELPDGTVGAVTDGERTSAGWSPP